MANQEHLDRLRRSPYLWNAWRKVHSEVEPDLSEADLSGTDLSRTNLSKADLRSTDLSNANLAETDLSNASLDEANLNKANLREANLSETYLNNAILTKTDLREADLGFAVLMNADLREANLSEADLAGAFCDEANFSHANLSGATLQGADLTHANLSGATLQGADLNMVILVGANLTEANLTDCSVYGIAAWNVELEGAIQSNLIITSHTEPKITVDNLEVAQFIYLLLNNKKIRDIIDTITSKVVLLLGRFTEERKQVLDALRDELRKQNYSPVLFDFEKPLNRDVTETVSTLAHMARFVIADITEPKSIPQELSHIIPFLPSVPIMPILQVSEREYGMYEHFISYPWVRPIYHYHGLDELLQSIQEHIIEPAEKMVKELAIEKAKRLESP